MLRPVILGSWSPPVLACVRSWGRRGWPVGLIAVSRQGEPLPASRYLTAVRRIDPRQLKTPDGFSFIRRFLADFRAHGILTIEESLALWLSREGRRVNDFPAVWFPEAERLQRLLDKEEQIEAARHVGLHVLPTARIEPPGDRVPQLAPDFFPVCVRPACGEVEPAFKVRVFKYQHELEVFVSGLKKLNKPLLCQPFRALPNLVVHGSRSSAGDVFGFQAFVVPRKFQGVTLTIRPIAMPNRLKDACRAFLDRLDVVGPFHFEFLWDPQEQRAWFLEINNRLGGTTAKVSACGYDEPGYALKAFGVFVPGMEDRPALRTVHASSYQALFKYTAFALTGRLTELDFPRRSPGQNIRAAFMSFFSCRDDVWAWDDISGSLSLYGTNLFGKLLSNSASL